MRETETQINPFPSLCLRFFPTLLHGACKLCRAFQERPRGCQAQHGVDLKGRALLPSCQH